VTAEIALRIMEGASRPLLSPVKRVAAADLPIPAGHLERWVLPKPQDIAMPVGAVMGVEGGLEVREASADTGFIIG